MQVRRVCVRVAVCAAVLSVSACGGEAPTETGLPPITGPTVTRVSITPRQVELEVGQTARLTATATDAANQAVGGVIISWASLDGTVATVASDGTVTALQPGSARIVASSATRADTAAVTVTAPSTQPPPTQPPPTQPPAVATVSVSPPAPSLQPRTTVQLSASAYDGGGTLLTGRSVTWTSSATSIATVSSSGLVTAVGLGTATISATIEGRTASATLTVVSSGVATVSITRPTATLLPGATAQLTATARDAAGQTVTGRTVVWSTSAPGVATVSSAGVVTAIAVGSTTVTANVDGVQASVTMSVEPTPVASVTVAPFPVTLTVGQTQQLTATARDANGQALTGYTVAWSGGSSMVATVSASGLVTALSAGSTIVTATVGGRSASVGVGVTAAVPVRGSATIARDTAGTVVGVGATGVPLPGVLVVGDDEANGLAPLQAIVVYSLATVPAGATLESATLPVGMQTEAVFGNPFALGSLYVERTTSIALNTSAIGTGSLLVAGATTANTSVDVLTLVRAAIAAGDGYIAFRFRFPRTGNSNGQTDQLELAIGSLTLNWVK